MKAAYTPGPWRAAGGNVYADVDRYYPRPVAQVGVPLERDDNRVDELMANARLIAAAPDLLAVVQELQESAAYWSEYDVPIGIVDRLNAAIAKATA